MSLAHKIHKEFKTKTLYKKMFMAIMCIFCVYNINAQNNDSLQINKLIKAGASLLKAKNDSAYIYFNNSLQIATKNKSARDSINVLFNLGKVYANANKYNEAKMYWHQTLKICQRTQVDVRREILSYIRLADVYNELTGAKDSAALYYYLAEQKFNAQKIDDPNFNAYINTHLAYYWLQLNSKPIKEDLDNGRYHIEKVRKDSALLNQNSRDELYFLEGFFYSVNTAATKDSARYYFLKYLENEKNLNFYDKVMAYVNLINACLDLGYFEESNVYLNKLQALKQNMHPVLLSYLESIIIKSEFVNKNYLSAIKSGTALIEKFKKEATLNVNVLEIYDMTAKAYDSLGRYKEASRYKSEYFLLADSLNNKARSQTASMLAIRSKMAEKDKALAQKELALAQSEITHKNKNFWIISIAIILVSLTVISILTYINNRNKIKSQEKQIEINHLKDTVEGEENERKRLARELHDGLGGIITAIRIHFGLINQNFEHLQANKTYQDGMQLIEEASTELRKTAHNLAPDLVTQHGLVYALEAFCSRIANGTNINLSFQALGEDPAGREASVDLTIYRVIQELSHNIVKHSGASKALVQIQFINNDVIITVEDNGIGLPPNILSTAKGIGLQNIKSRIENINGIFNIESKTDEGTSINIEIFN